jgi:hypothetical protein
MRSCVRLPNSTRDQGEAKIESEFQERYGKDKRTWDALKGASGGVGLPLFGSLQPFSGWNLLDGHTCQVVIEV